MKKGTKLVLLGSLFFVALVAGLLFGKDRSVELSSSRQDGTSRVEGETHSREKATPPVRVELKEIISDFFGNDCIEMRITNNASKAVHTMRVEVSWLNDGVTVRKSIITTERIKPGETIAISSPVIGKGKVPSINNIKYEISEILFDGEWNNK